MDVDVLNALKDLKHTNDTPAGKKLLEPRKVEIVKQSPKNSDSKKWEHFNEV